MNPGSNPDIILALCPPWGVGNPPLGLAYLATSLKRQGLTAGICDINLHLFRWSRRSEKSLWDVHNDFKWRDEKQAGFLMDLWEPKITELVEGLAASSVRVVGFTIVDPNETFSCSVIRRIKRRAPGLLVVAGGPGCASPGQREFLSGRSGNGINFFVVGEGEESLPALLNALRTGRDPSRIPGVVPACDVPDGNVAPCRIDIGSIPFPTFEEFDMSAYGRENLALMWSRGCVGKCLFCKERALWGEYRVRPVRSILDELRWHRERYGFRNFVVYDSVVNGRPHHLEAICDGIIFSPLDITWSAEAIPLPSLTRARLHKMRAAGCHTLVFGVESGSNRVLEAMNKPFRAKTAKKVLSDATYAGIKVSVNILVGFPGEGQREFEETLEFLRRNRRNIRRIDAISPLQIVDNTPLEERAEDLGIMFPEEEPSNRWHTRDGNTLQVRMERLRRVRDLALELGFEVGRTPGSSESGDKAPLRFQANPRYLLKRIAGTNREGSGFRDFGPDLVRRKIHRVLGKRGVASEISAGEKPVFDGIRDGSRASCGPQVVHLDITERCNFNCIACWDRSPLLGTDRQSAGETSRTLPLETISGFLDDLARMGGVREIKLGGGEPTMHPDFAEVIREIKSRAWNVKLEINTNFSRVDDALIDHLVQEEVDSLLVSLWAGSPSSYVKTHPHQTEETFLRITGQLKTLLGRREGGNPKVTIHNVLMNLNCMGLTDMVNLGLDTGVDEISFAFVDPVPGKTESLLISREERAAIRNQLTRIQKRMDRFGNYSGPGTGRSVRIANFQELMRRCSDSDGERGAYDRRMVERIPCYIGWLFVRIMADGSVVPCCKGHRMKMGNILEGDFWTIWNSETYRIFRQKALTMPKSDPYFSLMGNTLVSDAGCYNCDNLMHNLVCHRKVLSQSSLREWIRFELGQRTTRG